MYLQLIQSAWAESHASTTIFQDRNIIAVPARLSAHTDWISCTYEFGAISLFSILRHILCASYYAMVIILTCTRVKHAVTVRVVRY